MKLLRLEVGNYKSLRDIVFSPAALTLVIGPNGAGKSNLASALSFLADVYSNDLSFAVANKGGYENIAFRMLRRTKAAITFDVTVELTGRQAQSVMAFGVSNIKRNPIRSAILRHQFSFRASKQSINSDFVVLSESIQFYTAIGQQDLYKTVAEDMPTFSLRRSEGKAVFEGSDQDMTKYAKEYFDFYIEDGGDIGNADSDLLLLSILFRRATVALQRIGVFQISPLFSRQSSPPSPQPKLTIHGQNLPALVDWLRRSHPDRWKWVLETMREVVPTLAEVRTEYLHTKTLGLSFVEDGIGRPWAAEDISDGTIQALTILCALSDPRNDVISIDELENSLHPWIVRKLGKEIKELSKRTQIILPTHSPILLNLVAASDVWVCFKEGPSTRLEQLVNLAPDVVADWEQGSERLFELLDIGLVNEAMPGLLN